MKKKTISRMPLQGQDHFIIATSYVITKDLRRSLENCREMYVNLLRAGRIDAQEESAVASVCRECDVDAVFGGECGARVAVIEVSDRNFRAEDLRREVFSAVLCGATGIEYDSVLDGDLVWKSSPEPVFYYIQDMNYRLAQYGRTLMALRPVGVYCSDATARKYPELAERRAALSDSAVVAEQELPDGLALGEFADGEDNRYLMYQNVDCEDSKVRSFQIKLARELRAYRVNPHSGKQVVVKDKLCEQCILIMPGDGDLLRYQPAEDKPFLIEYALKK